MSQERRGEVSIEEAIQDFVQRYAAAWRQAKMRDDCEKQIREIERHKYFRSLQEGRDIGKATAAEEWIARYAPMWREERESLERNGFLRATVVVSNPRGIHLRPTSELADVARRYDADVYLNKRGMPYYNFLIGKKPYMNVRSVLGLLSLDIVYGDKLEFIATGAQAGEALAAIVKAVNESVV
jgi:phosphotransferase system HPr (HPr) family protein